MPESRAQRIAFYAIPMLFCLAVHWIAIKTWFSADDFAWLGLPLELHPALHDWLDVFFGPRAQGTVRTLSERTYFLVFTEIFGLNALPFRIWAFLTQFANLVLIAWIARRITGSKLAAFLAPILWTASAALAVALDWSSAYNEICCAFFLLLAFYFLLRFIETGERKFWIWQWVAFVLGFGALELIVMYPPIAALYTFLNARQYFRRTLWLFVPSALFTIVHFTLVPKVHDTNYSMHFDSGILGMLWKYWTFAVAAARPDRIDWRPLWLGTALALVVLAAMLFLLVRYTRLAVFCLAWFLLVILPVLPLTNHFTEYYATIPAIGIAILGGWAIARYPRVGIPIALLYLVVSITDIHMTDRYFYARARKIKYLVLGLESAAPLYAGKTVLLSGIDSDLFWTGFYDDPFRLLGITDIYVVPGAEKNIEPHPEWGSIDRFVMPLDKVVDALEKGKAEVFTLNAKGLQDITPIYRSIAVSQYINDHRETVDVGNPAYSKRLGPGWYKAEEGFRWMGKAAGVQLSGPQSERQRLYVSGFAPASVLAKGPLELSVNVDGRKVGAAVLKHADEHFDLDFALPAETVGKYAIQVSVEVSRTTQIGKDLRPLGLIFGTFRIK